MRLLAVMLSTDFFRMMSDYGALDEKSLSNL